MLDLSENIITVRWNDSGAEQEVQTSELFVADDQIVSGRIDMGRCMFCGLCMEACGFTSFFMTNEYDGMSGLLVKICGLMQVGLEFYHPYIKKQSMRVGQAC